MNKCVSCIFYNLRPNSLNYNLSLCLKHNVFSEVARLDENKCGIIAKDYMSNNPNKPNKQFVEKKDIENIIPFHI